MENLLLAIDQGTTSTRAIVFSDEGRLIQSAQADFEQIFPKNNWVEHDPEEIWATTCRTCSEVLSSSSFDNSKVKAIGIANQRETTLLWDRLTGEPVYNAIVWQDRRTADTCKALKERNMEQIIQEKTGLLLDPYFSATKLAWLLDSVPNVRKIAEKGGLAFGTIDTFLLWRLTGGKSHMTDATNASRTLLFNIHEMKWDPELLEVFNIPESILPEVKNNADQFGVVSKNLFGCEIPVTALIGDQQAALVGQRCIQPGMAKSTYGTGCFLMVNTGEKPLKSTHRLLSTLAYQVDDKAYYALEGSIFIAGAVVQWLRDSLKIVNSAEETEEIAKQHGPSEDVYLVPAFSGLGAPHWDPDARGAILGITRATGVAEIVSAGLQSVAYQARDLLEAMNKDGAQLSGILRIDGGMANNRWFVQFLSDMLDLEVGIPSSVESTALGAAFMAGIGAGIYQSLADLESLSQPMTYIKPGMNRSVRDNLYSGWCDAVGRVKS